MDAKQPIWMRLCLFAGAWALGGVGALPYAGSWNDGSRLAAVEAIVDHGVFAIDESVFVQPGRVAGAVLPYSRDHPRLLSSGTMDKLWIGGHFYSDKPYLISVLMAALYWMLQTLGLPMAAVRPDGFCYCLTIFTSGLAFAWAVCWMEALGRRAGLTGRWLWCWLGSFALATVALTYTRHVNNHIMLLGVMAGVLWHLMQLANEAHFFGAATVRERDCAPDQAPLPHGRGSERSAAPWRRLVTIAALAGLGYNLDLGSGPVLLAGLIPLVIWQTRRLPALAVFFLALAPWLIAHHAINYHVGGTFKPANAVPEYCAWPGSAFTQDNMTGLFRHSPGKLAVYALALLFGKHGFIGHNLPLFLALPAGWLLCRAGRRSWRPEGILAAAWVAGTFLMYAAFSNNYGGACCSVRWFVPFLAPGFWLLAWLLVRHPQFRGDFLVLTAGGLALSSIMWWHGPWITKMVPFFWPIQAAALASCVIYRCRRPILAWFSANANPQALLSYPGEVEARSAVR